jgi:hypothetical protein
VDAFRTSGLRVPRIAMTTTTAHLLFQVLETGRFVGHFGDRLLQFYSKRYALKRLPVEVPPNRSRSRSSHSRNGPSARWRGFLWNMPVKLRHLRRSEVHLGWGHVRLEPGRLSPPTPLVPLIERRSPGGRKSVLSLI